MGTGFAKQKKQAKHMQQQMMQLQQTVANKMSALEIHGEAGGGLVKITLTGTGEMKKIQINPECVDKEDIEGLEALIKAAYSTAFKEVQSLAESSADFGTMPDLSMLGM
jgi:hypothetical protein